MMGLKAMFELVRAGLWRTALVVVGTLAAFNLGGARDLALARGDSPFPNNPANHWAFRAIENLNRLGLTPEDLGFCYSKQGSRQYMEDLFSNIVFGAQRMNLRIKYRRSKPAFDLYLLPRNSISSYSESTGEEWAAQVLEGVKRAGREFSGTHSYSREINSGADAIAEMHRSGIRPSIIFKALKIDRSEKNQDGHGALAAAGLLMGDYPGHGNVPWTAFDWAFDVSTAIIQFGKFDRMAIEEEYAPALMAGGAEADMVSGQAREIKRAIIQVPSPEIRYFVEHGLSRLTDEFEMIGYDPKRLGYEWRLALSQRGGIKIARQGMANEPFADVPSNHWAASALHSLRSDGLMRGKDGIHFDG